MSSLPTEGSQNKANCITEKQKGGIPIVEFKHKKQILNKIAESNQDDPSLLSGDHKMDSREELRASHC